MLVTRLIPVVVTRLIVYAYYDRSDAWHARAKKLMQVGSYYFVADLPHAGYVRVAELNRQFDDLDLVSV